MVVDAVFMATPFIEGTARSVTKRYCKQSKVSRSQQQKPLNQVHLGWPVASYCTDMLLCRVREFVQ